MAAGNTITLVGNMTRDPELRFIPSGAAVANFGIAVNKRWQNKQTQEWEEEVAFFDIVCWRELAENVSESLTKGTRVIVTGALQQRSWKSDSGEKRTKVEVLADEVGPSMRWATAQVARTERRDGSDRGAPPPPPAGSYGDEDEPF